MSELSQEARALIESVSTLDDPSDEDRSRIRKRLALQLGASTFATLAASNVAGVTDKAVVASKSGLFGLAGKAALCAGALCAAGSIWLLDWHQPPSQQPAAQVSSQLPASAPARVVERAAEPPLAPVLDEPAQSATEPAASGASALRERRRPTPPEPVAEPAPPRATTAPGGLAAELALLGRAQAALRAGQSGQALALALEHEATFPHGVMKEERLGVAALAECALSPDARERSHVQTFLSAAASSPLAARVRKACGIE